MRWGQRLWLVVFAAALLNPALAQYDDDEQTKDYEERDRRYLERYLEPDSDDKPANSIGDSEQAFLAKAEELIRDRNYRAARSEHYRVRSDDPRLDAKAATVLLEDFRAWFDGFWGDSIELLPYDKQSQVFLFYSFYAFNQLMQADFTFSTLRPQGHYGSSFDVITLHSDAGSPADLADTLIHEAAHQLVDQRLGWTSGSMPSWLSEGLASYFGYTRMVSDTGFIRGSVGGKAATLIRGAKSRRSGQAASRLRLFREAMAKQTSGQAANRDRPASLFGELLSFNRPAQFYGQNALVNYSASWVLIHYLLEGEDGRHRQAFAEFLGDPTHARAPREALLTAIGMHPSELDEAVKRHAKSIKVR